MQRSIEQLVANRVERFDPGLSAAVVVIDNATGEILASVGSAGYMNYERKGAVDATLALRSPGSALKPFAYAAAFEHGLLSPSSILADTPISFSGHAPRNFDLIYRGPVSARTAL